MAGGAEAGHRGGSPCHQAPRWAAAAPTSPDGQIHPGQVEGEGRGLWRRRNRKRGAETCCWRRSGRSWSCSEGLSCWSSHCPGLGLGPGPGPGLGPCRGCCAVCRRRCGGCASGGGCGASDGRGRRSVSPGCPAGNHARRAALSGGESGVSGTWRRRRRSWTPADGRTTSWSRVPRRRHSALRNPCHAPTPAPTRAVVVARTGWPAVAAALPSGGGRRGGRGPPCWGTGGNRVARWDGRMRQGGRGADRGDTPAAPGRPPSSGTPCSHPLWRRLQRRRRRRAACPEVGSRCPGRGGCSRRACREGRRRDIADKHQPMKPLFEHARRRPVLSAS